MHAPEIYLVSAPATSPLKDMINRAVGTLPVGLASIAAILVENGYTVQAADLFNNRASASSFRSAIASLRPRIVGITTATETYSNALRLARICKDVDPQIQVILGGPHVTFTAEETLQEPAVAVVVRGEGEFSMLELAGFYLRGMGSLERIKGISFRSNGVVTTNPPRSFIQHLDEMPFLGRHLFPEDYSVPGNILTSRGCPAHCVFCSAAAMSGGKYRTRSAENVVDEIVYVQRLGVGRKMKFLDDTVTADARRLERMLNLLEAMDVKILWGAESRVDVVTERSLERMAELGCVSLQFGVESGSQEVLNRIRKGIRLEQVIQAVQWATRTIKHVCCSFVIGHPFDSEDTIQETVQLGLRLQNEYSVEVLFSIATPYPGTYIYNHAAELGLLNLSKSYDDYNFLNPVFDTPALSRQRLRNLQFEIMQRVFSSMPQKVKQHYQSQGEV